MTTAAHKAEWLRNNLKKGEIYAGLILGENGAPDYHLVAMPTHKDKTLPWDKAMAAAKAAQAELPNRREARLLFINAREHFKKDWYWTSEQHAGDGVYAWCQLFANGNQLGSHKSLNCGSVVLVRRIAIQ